MARSKDLVSSLNAGIMVFNGCFLISFRAEILFFNYLFKVNRKPSEAIPSSRMRADAEGAVMS